MTVLGYEDALKIKRTSIYLDACFLLKLSDVSDPQYQNCKTLISNWGPNGNKVGISSHVYGEVVHNFFIRQILEAIYLRSKVLQGETLCEEQIMKIGEISLIDHLITLANNQDSNSVNHYVYHVDNALNMTRYAPTPYSHFSYNKINVNSLVKRLKKNTSYPSDYRKSLNHHYQVAADKFKILIYVIEHAYNQLISWEITDRNLMKRAHINIVNYQLDAHDAIHFAIAMKNKYKYFITTDGDYVKSSYTPNLKQTNIIHIS